MATPSLRGLVEQVWVGSSSSLIKIHLVFRWVWICGKLEIIPEIKSFTTKTQGTQTVNRAVDRVDPCLVSLVIENVLDLAPT